MHFLVLLIHYDKSKRNAPKNVWVERNFYGHNRITVVTDVGHRRAWSPNDLHYLEDRHQYTQMTT